MCSRAVVHAEPLKPSTRLYEREMDQVHDMTNVGANKTQSTQDSVKFWIHNLVNTHVDALSHVGYAGDGFNGHRFGDIVDMEHGAKIQDVCCLTGVVTQAHLTDLAGGRGVDVLPAGSLVRPEDLLAHIAEVERGDAVLIRTGASITGGRPVEDPATDQTFGRGSWPGLHPDSFELLATKDISIIGGDAIEPFPCPIPEVGELDPRAVPDALCHPNRPPHGPGATRPSLRREATDELPVHVLSTQHSRRDGLSGHAGGHTLKSRT